MLTLHEHPLIADQQIIGLTFCLTCFGYVDGDFDDSERIFVREYIEKVVRAQAEGFFDSSERPWERERRIEAQVAHFDSIFRQIDAELAEAAGEIVAAGESQENYILTRLELEAYRVLKQFDAEGQQAIFDTVDELLMADGVAHPAELEFRRELQALLEVNATPIEVEEDLSPAPPVDFRPPTQLSPEGRNHPIFTALERHYPASPTAMAQMLADDVNLVADVMNLLWEQREAGQGKLAGATTMRDFAGQSKFLDNFVWVVPPAPNEAWEITVLGDLHGCYSCLKAAVIQSRFFERVAAWERDPNSVPRPALVFLGDYVDRGLYNFHGVMRGALELFKAAPDHVYLLRGNHEFFFDLDGEVMPAVRPAEALKTLKTHSSYNEQLAYKNLFDSLPTALVFDQVLFVHGGIPKDSTMRDNFSDLTSLNDPQVRMDMMWGDPADTDFVPEELQAKATRFSFGRQQCEAFLRKLGCHTMIRGHEKLTDGYAVTYQDERQVVVTVFSAGGSLNEDLPLNSSYRKVDPKALTVHYNNGELALEPWTIAYGPYVTPELNAFYASDAFIKP